jgi:small subunit ribosomal protein S4
MGRLNTAKNKIARREGVDLSLKTFGTKAHASLLKRLTIIPGHKQVRKINTKLSDYGRQLREKQKMKRIYDVAEKKMVSYFEEAVRLRGNSMQNLVNLLESRLDNVVYRLHFAPTRASARQMVSHGHIAVNGKKLSIPSYQVKVNDVISFVNPKTAEIPYVKVLLDEKTYTLPVWLKREGPMGKVAGAVSEEEYKEPVNVALVIEFYSKL